MPWLMAAIRLPVCRQMALSFQWLTGETRACAASGGTGGEKRNGSRAGDSTHWAKCDCTKLTSISVADEGALVPGVVRMVARAASEAAAAGGGLAGAAAGTSAELFEAVADPTELRGGRNW